MIINQKRFLVLPMMVIISLLAVLFSVTAAADSSTSQGIGPSSGTCGDNVTWTLSDGILRQHRTIRKARTEFSV